MQYLSFPLVTTWPAFTEAMYLLGRADGIDGQAALWRLVLTERVEIVEVDRGMLERSAALTRKCADRPMDLAYATLVAFAGQHDQRRLFTLDEDFGVYRLHGRARFDVVPR